jgi:hypothetical protein
MLRRNRQARHPGYGKGAGGIEPALLRFSSSRPAPALEGHRSMPDLSPSASGTGYASTFARGGFKTVAQ